MIFTVNISNEDITILENDLLDIDDWIQKAVVGKINSSKTRMVDQATAVLKADLSVTSIPTNDAAVIALLIARPGYKNRKDREPPTP